MRWSWAVPILRGRQGRLGLPTAARLVRVTAAEGDPAAHEVAAFARRLVGRDERLGVVQRTGAEWSPVQGAGEVLVHAELRPGAGEALMAWLAGLGAELDRLAAGGWTLAAADQAVVRAHRPGAPAPEPVPLWTGGLLDGAAPGYLEGWVRLHEPLLADAAARLEARGAGAGAAPPALTLCLPRDLVQVEPAAVLVPASLSA